MSADVEALRREIEWLRDENGCLRDEIERQRREIECLAGDLDDRDAQVAEMALVVDAARACIGHGGRAEEYSALVDAVLTYRRQVVS